MDFDKKGESILGICGSTNDIGPYEALLWDVPVIWKSVRDARLPVLDGLEEPPGWVNLADVGEKRVHCVGACWA